MNNKGSALMTVLIVVILVPLAIFGATAFISSSLLRHTTQNRKSKALYLSQTGIHRAIYNIRSTGTPGSPGTPFTDTIAGDTINVTLTGQGGAVYQFKSVGTSNAANYPMQISRTTSAQYDYNTNNISLCVDGDGSNMPSLCGSIFWPFSEGSGSTTDTSPVVPAYRGTLYGTAPVATLPAWATNRFGTAARALSFNVGVPTPTHNYVIVPDSAGLDLTTEGTITAWIRMTAFPADGTGVVRRGSLTSASAQEAYGLLIVTQGPNRRPQIMIRESDGGARRTVTAGGGGTLAVGTWYFLAGTWGPLGTRVFVNGVTQGSNAAVRSSYNTTSPLHIGTLRSNNSGTRFFGTIDDVNLYSCQKTGAEILDLYNASKP